MRTLEGLHLDPAEVIRLDALLTALVQCAKDARPAPASAALISEIRFAARRLTEQNRSASATTVVGVDAGGRPLPHDLLTTAEAAQILGITSAGVRQLARRGTITAHRVGRQWLLLAADVLARSERRR